VKPFLTLLYNIKNLIIMGAIEETHKPVEQVETDVKDKQIKLTIEIDGVIMSAKTTASELAIAKEAGTNGLHDLVTQIYEEAKLHIENQDG